MKRAVFLDRDGVLNRAFLHADGKTHPPASPEELEILPGVLEACQSLRRAGFLLIVVTNQPDVARGTQRREVVEAINLELRRQLPLDDIQSLLSRRRPITALAENPNPECCSKQAWPGASISKKVS